MKNLVFVFSLLIIFGCASVKKDFIFDGSSPESIKLDINHIFSKLSRSERLEFSVALLAIQLSDVNSAFDMVGDPAMESINYFILSKKIDGLNYEQVLELASKSKTKVVVSTK